jgi:hypothetical protein
LLSEFVRVWGEAGESRDEGGGLEDGGTGEVKKRRKEGGWDGGEG